MDFEIRATFSKAESKKMASTPLHQSTITRELIKRVWDNFNWDLYRSIQDLQLSKLDEEHEANLIRIGYSGNN